MTAAELLSADCNMMGWYDSIQLALQLDQEISARGTETGWHYVSKFERIPPKTVEH